MSFDLNTEPDPPDDRDERFGMLKSLLITAGLFATFLWLVLR